MQDKIVEFLKKSDGYISGEEISDALGVSRAAVWKYIQDLRENDYEIVAVPHLGYKLISIPDKLFPAEIQYQLNTRIIGKKIFHFETMGSTMDEAFTLGLKGEPEGVVVCAEGQTKGRGRLGRSWMSPKGKGIYLSIILRPNFSPTQTAQLTLMTAVAICDAIKKTTGLQPAIKWPNDVLFDNHKAAGILTELSAEMDRVKFVVVGIGLNVNTLTAQLPQGATSLRAQTKQSLSRIKMIQEMLRSFEDWYLTLQKKGFAPVLKKWKEMSATLGKNVKVKNPSGEIEGLAVDVDTDGSLMIRKSNGVIVRCLTGDVVGLR